MLGSCAPRRCVVCLTRHCPTGTAWGANRLDNIRARKRAMDGYARRRAKRRPVDRQVLGPVAV
jgi:hypothetical protein